METKKQSQSKLERNKEIIKNIKLAYKNAKPDVSDKTNYYKKRTSNPDNKKF